MKGTFLRTSLLVAATLATSFVATDANAFTISGGGNLRETDAELFNLFNSSVNIERLEMGENNLPELFADSLKWDGIAGSVDVFFINEGAGYRNQLLFSLNDGPKHMLFDDVASPESILANSNGPLMLGDGKSIEDLSGNIGIDFFVKANGKWNSNGNVYGADVNEIADGLQHMIAREFKQDNDNWVLIGFEDLYGAHYSEGGRSDRDFNDVVIAVRGVTGDRVDGTTTEVPEPMVTLGLVMVGAVGATTWRRRQVVA